MYFIWLTFTIRSRKQHLRCVRYGSARDGLAFLVPSVTARKKDPKIHQRERRAGKTQKTTNCSAPSSVLVAGPIASKPDQIQPFTGPPWGEGVASYYLPQQRRQVNEGSRSFAGRLLLEAICCCGASRNVQRRRSPVLLLLLDENTTEQLALFRARCFF